MSRIQAAKEINFFCCCFSPRDIRIQTVSYNISLVCLVCAVQLLLLDFVALPGFWLVGIWQRRKLNSCSFSKQEVIKLNWVFSRWISWKGHDPRGNDCCLFQAGVRTELQVPQFHLVLLCLVSRQKVRILEIRWVGGFWEVQSSVVTAGALSSLVCGRCPYEL